MSIDSHRKIFDLERLERNEMGVSFEFFDII